MEREFKIPNTSLEVSLHLDSGKKGTEEIQIKISGVSKDTSQIATSLLKKIKITTDLLEVLKSVPLIHPLLLPLLPLSAALTSSPVTQSIKRDTNAGIMWLDISYLPKGRIPLPSSKILFSLLEKNIEEFISSLLQEEAKRNNFRDSKSSTSSDKTKDAYRILDIREGASVDEIKKAYRKKVMEVHPDKNKDPTAEKQFIELTDAYTHLLNIKRERGI